MRTGLAVTLPDGIDLTDRAVQSRVEAIVREGHGDYAVVMWPRYPDVEDGIDPVVPIVDARPQPTEIALDASVKPTEWHRVMVFGEERGLGDLVEFDPYRRRAVFAHLGDDARAIRNRLADLLRAQPHEVEVACLHSPDEHGGTRLDQVVVLRAPVVGISPDKRAQTWADLVLTLPGGSSGWEAVDDPVTGRVRLRFGKPRVLPDLVPMADLLPDRLVPQEWARIPLGVTPEGRVALVDLAAGPHGLVVGPTGTGKTVALLQWAVSALVRGHRLVIVDPTKAGLDFLAVRPWCSAWADTLEQGQAVIERVYAEVARRKRILQQFEAVKWSDLPPEVRRDHDVHPTTVIIDEYGSLVLEESVPKSLPRDSEFREQAEARNVARAIIAGTVGRIAREARFAGVHLVIALQRPDAQIISGELRSNLTSAVQLAAPGKPLSLDALRMVLPGDVAGQAAETLAELDDGKSRGLAVMAAEGGAATGFRGAYGAPAEIPPLLEMLGVLRPEPWEVEGPPEPEPPPLSPIGPPPTPSPGQPAEPEITDLGEIELNLDDLDLAVEEDQDPHAGPATVEQQAEVIEDFADHDFDAKSAAAVRAQEDDEFTAPTRPRPKVDLSDIW